MKYRFIVLVLCIFLLSCGLSDLGKPFADIQDNWVKSGFTKNETREFSLKQCNYESNQGGAAFQQCMLDNGFSYIEPSGFIKRCELKNYREEIECISIKKK